jgi:DNA-binding HxlR family transcriptional regulator
VKLEIVTSPIRRHYDDACGTAFALELVGERWALLVVRELMFGPRRFGELRAGLPGISANVLTQRLVGLQAANIVQRRKLPPPASVQVYELTPWGYESERAIQELGRWATRSPGHDPTLPLSAASLMLSFRTLHSAERAAGMDARIGFRIGQDMFVAHLTGAGIAIRRADLADCDTIFTAPNAMAIAGAVYGGVPIPTLEAAGALSIGGDRSLAERFVTLFPLPPKFS